MIIHNKKAHQDVMLKFLKYLNQRTNGFILKGGTSLHLCYGLDRFSEDLDFDTERNKIDSIVKSFCAVYKFHCNEKKNSSYGQRFMIDYGVNRQLLKIESSILRYRNAKLNNDEIVLIQGIRTYDITSIAQRKLHAFMDRDKIRDMYDVAFIIIKYWERLTKDVQSLFYESLKQKGLQHCQRMIDEQKDDLISEDELGNKVLHAFDKIGLLE